MLVKMPLAKGQATPQEQDGSALLFLPWPWDPQAYEFLPEEPCAPHSLGHPSALAGLAQTSGGWVGLSAHRQSTLQWAEAGLGGSHNLRPGQDRIIINLSSRVLCS